MMKKVLRRVFVGMGVAFATLILNCQPVYAAPKEAPEEVVEEEVTEPEVKKPTLNADVSDKALTVHAESEVGIKSIYVNGYEFPNSGNGTLKIKLQQFDAGYKTFYIYAEDLNGVASDLYEVANPYFDEDPTDDVNLAEELPLDAEATEPGSAEGYVTEHFMSNGREFYTIETINGKVFYLIVDMTSDEELVYFVTEINENDLLNTTSGNSETLPRNSAIADGIVPEDGEVIVNNNASESTINTIFGVPKTEESTETSEVKKDNSKEKAKEVTDAVTEVASQSSSIIYIVMGVICVAVIAIVYLGKKKKKKKSGEQALNQSVEEETDDEEDDDEE